MDAVYNQVFTVFGLAGCVCYVISYLLVQIEYIDGNDYSYVFLNLAASIMMLISLTSAFNLGAAVVQIFWILISGIGIVRKSRQPRTRRQQGLR